MEFFSGCVFAKPKTVAAGQRNVTHSRTRELELLEDTLAAEMSNLSFQERAKAMDDLHCVGESLEENEETRKRSLDEFDQIANATKTRIYDLAARQNRDFIEDESFRLKFLRANLYDVKKAVRQMMRFLHFKATYFGEDSVAREIELSDLTEEEATLMLKSGLYFVPKHKDKAGRLVLIFLSHLLSTRTKEALIRVIFFHFYNLLASLPETQLKGITALIYYDTCKPGEEFIVPSFQDQRQAMAVAHSIPCRYTSLHICMKPTNGISVLNNAAIRSFLNTRLGSTLVRTKLHIGSDMEIQYNLQNYGISRETCPVDSSGEIHQGILNTWYESHLEYMKSRGQCVDHLVPSKSPATIGSTSIEKGEAINYYATDDIRATDVLFGRGRGYQDHAGNNRFRNALEDYRDAYDRARRYQKHQITMEVRQMLAADGVRFLKQVDGTKWVESDSKSVEEKIGQLFRTARKKKDV